MFISFACTHFSSISQISGTPSCVLSAKEAILEKCETLKAEREDRALKSFELKVSSSYDGSFDILKV